MEYTAANSTNAATGFAQFYVGLTTLPSRIELLRDTLDSLLSQTRRPDKVLLCLPSWSRREQCAYQQPAWLRGYRPTVEVVECTDHGPGTKLLGCLDHLPADACLVVVDDDMRYRPYMLEMLYEAQTADPASSFSFWTFPCGPFIVGQGADGFSFHASNLTGIRQFAERALQHPRLRLVDDLWISAYLHRQGVAVRSLKHLIPGGGTVYEAAHDVNQLRNLQDDTAREAVMIEGTRYLLESGMMGPAARAQALAKRALRAARDTLLARGRSS